MTELKRTLVLFDAIVVGLGAIIGAGIFVGLGPAAAKAGPAVLLSLLVAAVPALLNALSSAALAATLPQAGGTYHFARTLLAPWAGFAAGWSFLVAKLVSGAVMATGFGAYLAGGKSGPTATLWALGLVALGTIVNLRGAKLSSGVTALLVVVKIGLLLVFVAAGLAAGVRVENFEPWAPGGWRGVWQGAALVFFAFAGYARIATLSEEVIEPRRTIPRAVIVSLAVSLALYLLVVFVAVGLVGTAGLTVSNAPLLNALRARGVSWAAPALTLGAPIALASVFLTLLTGTSRVFFAMARSGDLPGPLARVGARTGSPTLAVLVSGLIVACLTLTGSLPVLIAMNGASILFYYALTNVAALRLTREQRRFPAFLCVLGFALCLVLMAGLPPSVLKVLALVLAVGLAGFAGKEAIIRRGA